MTPLSRVCYYWVMNEKLIKKAIKATKGYIGPSWVKQLPNLEMAYVNHHYETLTGRKSRDYIGRTDAEVMPLGLAKMARELDELAVEAYPFPIFRLSEFNGVPCTIIKHRVGSREDGVVIGYLGINADPGHSDQTVLLQSVADNLKDSLATIEEHLQFRLSSEPTDQDS